MSTKRLPNKNLLIFHELKITKPRLAVLQAFRDHKKPVSANEIIEKIDPTVVNQTTVYRIIESFEQLGIIRQVNLRHKHTDYELIDERDHHHVVCTLCGYIEDFEDCIANKLSKNILDQSKNFSSIEDHALEFFGTCKKCSKG